eukprot:TRINITY_DN531_c0_g1_i1.p1 TRINITY_DN531_c0_g1~~TRINITY_DN531_c0_g1_i1.p1  ORF type:complete len:826 (-),score=183.65 TRINITY_DN531_c0_g1_i1:71-2548(-)
MTSKRVLFSVAAFVVFCVISYIIVVEKLDKQNGPVRPYYPVENQDDVHVSPTPLPSTTDDVVDFEDFVEDPEDSNLIPEDVSNSTSGAAPGFKMVFYRSIGNDLPPRHAIGQCYNNVKFMLENEDEFPGVEKRWIVNKIVNKEQETLILNLLREHKQKFIHIPIDLAESRHRHMRYEGFVKKGENPDILHTAKFQRMTPKEKYEMVEAMYHDKIIYVMDVNGARNRMIQDAIENGKADWVLPFDGNCFMTQESYRAIVDGIRKYGKETKYFAVPMLRVRSNDQLFDGTLNISEAKEEHQLIFRKDAKERFNENMRYGRREKIEMLWRLQIHGVWDTWRQSAGPWEKKEWMFSTDAPIPETGVPIISWIARLYSGQANLEVAGQGDNRALRRSEGVFRLLEWVDLQAAEKFYGFNFSNLLAWDENILEEQREAWKNGDVEISGLITSLLSSANASLSQGPWSVTDKSTFAPSEDAHDYFTVAPYYWPNQSSDDGLPYEFVKDVRVPGTALCSEGSDEFDQCRLNNMIRNTTVLGLAYYFTGDETYILKAAENLQVWFLDPETRMNPHLRYAQVARGVNDNIGFSIGLQETRDFFYLLDIFRLAHRAGALSSDEMLQSKQWMREFLDFLLDSDQAQYEYIRPNNRGLFFDLQVASIAAFVGDWAEFLAHTERSKARMLQQFDYDGTMVNELAAADALNQEMLALQAWFQLARIASMAGVDLYNFKSKQMKSPYLLKAVQSRVPQFNQSWSSPSGPWSHSQASKEVMKRMLPIYYAAKHAYGDLLADSVPDSEYSKIPSAFSVTGEFNPVFGIQLYWNLGTFRTTNHQ